MNHDVAEPLIAFLDANIILEGKPVADLPWEEVTAEGTIRVLIVPKAMEEIDAKKRDGRLGPYARTFNRLIAQSVIADRPIVLRDSDPRVELQMAKCSRIPWEKYDELDPDDGDSRIVAEAINARDVSSSRRVLISHDIKPLAYARARDLPIHQASDTWLRPVEPSPKDKEIQRLKQQLAEIKKDEPIFDISIEVLNSTPLKIHKLSPLETEQEDAVKSEILRKNSKISQRRDHFSIGLYDYDSSYDEKYKLYLNNTIPDFVSNFHEYFQLLFNQRIITVHVKNVGQIRADHLVLSLKVNDGWINRKIIIVSPKGPLAPMPRPALHPFPNIPNIKDLIRPQIGRHEFQTTRPANRTNIFEENCEDFRSGQDYFFNGIIMPSLNQDALEITVSLTAANLRGKKNEVLKIEKQIIFLPVGDLVDIKTLSLKEDYPLKDEIHRLLNLKKHDDLEWGYRKYYK